MRFFKYIIVIFLVASCAVEQDYYFDKNGEVKMDVGIDMSALYKNMPGGGGTSSLAGIKDSLAANSEIKDSMEYFGITKFDVDFDTSNYTLSTAMTFKDMEYFQKFMNKDRGEDLKPIDIKFTKGGFTVKNCASLISDEMLKGLQEAKTSQQGAGTDDMDMSQFFTFKTTYHFPYEVEKFQSESGQGMLSEDKKSISFENKLNDFTDDGFNGDLEVFFKK